MGTPLYLELVVFQVTVCALERADLEQKNDQLTVQISLDKKELQLIEVFKLLFIKYILRVIQCHLIFYYPG